MSLSDSSDVAFFVDRFPVFICLRTFKLSSSTGRLQREHAMNCVMVIPNTSQDSNRIPE